MLLTGGKIVTLQGNQPYGLISHGAIAIEEGKIIWVGDVEKIPSKFRESNRRELEGRLVTPALIDCHTHAVHAGNRAHEFEMRLQGVSYEQISQRGGGILSTVRATRGASEAALLELVLPRIERLIDEGVGIVEIKSGYGLEVETELKMLRVARQIERRLSIRVITSFLAAHALPDEYKGKARAYIEEICLPALHLGHKEGLIDAVDAFCEGIAFSPAELEPLLNAAKKLNLPVRLHAEQLSNCGGIKLAARFNALSADHLEYAEEEDIHAMHKAAMVAVLLPGAFYTLQETRHPPIDLLRAYQVPMAIATDLNPGSSPMNSLLLAMNMACTLFRLTPEEALSGVTKHAAAALDIMDCGKIVPGMRADLAIWDVGHPAELSCQIGINSLHARYFAGECDAPS